MPGNIKNVIAAIDYIESHLHEKPDLETIAEAVNYSKYHLHRMFTGTVGLTIRTYVQRRRLTEAAKLLVFSDKPILEIALAAGYESQQSFTDSFRAMYKKTPNQYREEEFYPLQLRYVLNENPANLEGEACWQQKITYATEAGRPGIGMALGISAGAANILFDYIFMVPMRMGIKGAALGTGIGYLIPAVAGILFFTVGNGSLHFRKPVMDSSILAGSCVNGFSEMVSQAASAVTTFLFNRIMMKLPGEDGVAAITIIICMRFIILVSIVIFGSAIAFGSPLVSFFSEKGTPVYEIARKGFLIFPFSFLFCGLNIFTSAIFTALSNGKLSAVLSFLRTFGLILVLLLILPEFMGVTGVWLAVPAAELLTMAVALAFLYQNKDRYHYA